MQVFKAFLNIAKKRLPSISFYFIIFFTLIIFMIRNADANINSNFESTSLDVCVIDEDNSEASDAVTNYLDQIHNLIDLPNDPEIIQDNLYYRYVDYVLIIPEGFSDMLAEGNTSGLYTNVTIPGSANSLFVDQQIDAYTQTMQTYLAASYSLKDAIAATDKSVAERESIHTVSFTADTQDRSNNIFVYYRYLVYILLVLLISGLTPLLVTINAKQVQERTLCSSISTTSRMLQIILGSGCYSFVIWIIFMLAAILFYGKNFFTAYSLYGALNSFVFLLFSASFTVFVSNFAPSATIAHMIANVVSLCNSFLCGVFVPQNMLSDQIVKVSRFLPGYWYTRANDMLGGLCDASFDQKTYFICIGVEFLFAAAFFVASLVASKTQKQDLAN